MEYRHRHGAIAFLLCTPLMIMILPRTSGTTEGWGDFTSVISNAEQNLEEYKELISLLANASYLSYTSTVGSSYWHPQDQNASIGEGWTRESFKSDPPRRWCVKIKKKSMHTSTIVF